MRQDTLLWFGVMGCWLATVGCTVRERRPDGPYRAAQEFADALSDQAVDCTRNHTPEGSGVVAIAADCANAETAPVIHDLGSMPGADAALACIRKGALETLKCPAPMPGRYVRIRVPVPLVTSEVTYAFMHELPQ